MQMDRSLVRLVMIVGVMSAADFCYIVVAVSVVFVGVTRIMTGR